MIAQRTTQRRLLIAACSLLGLAVMLGHAATASAEVLKKGLTWPELNISIRTDGGWIVAEARTSDLQQQLIWRKPLAPAGPGAVIQHGWGSIFVQVGPRQFVIDNATGRVQELRAGQIVRAVDPVFPPHRAPAPSGETPGGTQDTSLLTPQQAAMERLSQANQDLAQAMVKMDTMYRLRRSGQATDIELHNSQIAVADARQSVLDAQDSALREITSQTVLPARPTAPTSAPAIVRAIMMPPPAKAGPEVIRAERRVLDLTAAYAKASQELDRLRADSTTAPRAIEQAEAAATALSTQITQADRDLRRLRIEDGITFDKLSLTLQGKMTDAQQRLVLLTSHRDDIEDQLSCVQAFFELGDASEAAVQKLQNQLLDTIKKANEVQKELGDLRLAARKELGLEEVTTAPADK